MSNPLLDEMPGRADPRQRTDGRERPDARVLSDHERVPMGGNNQRLTLTPVPGYHSHWFNDVNDRIQRAIAGGYVFRPNDGSRVGTSSELGHTDMGSAVSKVVGTHANGQPLRAYAMIIKQAWYDADQAAKGKPIRQTEADILGGTLIAQDGDSSKNYVPEEGNSIE